MDSMKNVHFDNADEAIATLRMATEAACVGVWDRNLLTNQITGSEQYWKILDVASGSGLDFEGLVQLIPIPRTVHWLSSPSSTPATLRIRVNTRSNASAVRFVRL